MDDLQTDTHEPFNVWAIIGLNFFVVIAYVYLLLPSNISDSVLITILFAHVVICICCALYRQGENVGWWVSSFIVAFPLTSLLIN
jgi:hypothetical protein